MDHEHNPREGDFNALYDAHYAAVRAYAWRRAPAFVDEIVADTFLVAWRRLEDVPAAAARPWLLGVARNSHLNIVRSERRRREHESSEAFAWPTEDACPQPEPLGESDGGVLQLLRLLPEADREVLLLVAWEGLDRADIAKVLVVSRGNVALRLYRARRRFRALLDQDYLAEAAEGADIQATAPHVCDSQSRPCVEGVEHE
jgi:RNA polymerase sigma-70 factor (ECF subfamily)